MTARRDATTPASPLVLVVEDDPETRQFYSDALQREGFVVEQAHNGHQALHKALEMDPDLILTDIAVPGIDGIELCRRLRADSRTHDIPVLAISGYGDRQYADRARMAGADRMLAKPCDADLIVDEARRLLLSRVGRALARVENGREP
jgi:CheY-like chemotaxis protein